MVATRGNIEGGEECGGVEVEEGMEGAEGEEGEEVSAAVAGLRALAAFEFRVRAHAAVGAGPVSRAAAATTPAPDAPGEPLAL